MAHYLGLGLTHYPLLAGTDEHMADLFRWTLADPDIPADRQRIRILTAGAVADAQLRLDTRTIGLAKDTPMVPPTPGVHQLALIDARGRIVDRSLFTVR